MFNFIHIDLFLQALPIVAQGMLGIFVVTAAIIVVVMLLDLFGKLFSKKK
ncbi:MAG: hypothetical protein IJ408_04910 [Clostridia bacterium]|nr:hypothetical protein [Clostridia bacterium]